MPECTIYSGESLAAMGKRRGILGLMRILIDDSLPPSLAAELSEWSISIAREEGWGGMREGEILRTAAGAGFDIILTADRTIAYRENLRQIGIAVLVLRPFRNRIEELRLLVPQVLSILPLLRPGDVYEIAPLKGDAICDRPAASRRI